MASGNRKIWKILSEKKFDKAKVSEIVDQLLENRGISGGDKKTFFELQLPRDVTLAQLGIEKSEIRSAIERVKKTLSRKEKIIIYGDYDADGICASAILWETLNALGFDALPYLPERFTEGYGLNTDSVKKLKKDYPNLGLIITVDNGIVAHKAVTEAKKLKVDVIITDHHQKEKKVPKAHSVIHTDKISGSGLAWIFAREIKKGKKLDLAFGDGLELVAIGTVSDQLPLTGINRSLVKFGIERLRKTQRSGLLELLRQAAIEVDSVGTYTIGFIIGPRLNAMGRLSHALDSLRLLCTKNPDKAWELAELLGKTNLERQKIVESVVVHAREAASATDYKGMIILSHESYHEGVIGLAAAKIVDEYYRPAIVLSKGEKISKGSARSIPGFNIIQAIREFGEYLVDGGGHPMAAGFTIESSKLDEFSNKLVKASETLLTEEILIPSLKIDMMLEFPQITYPLVLKLKEFEPLGLGNPTPTFLTEDVEVVNVKTVGSTGSHLKLIVTKENKKFGVIGFGLGEFLREIKPKDKVSIVYSIEENVWNGNTEIQLKLKDIKTNTAT